MLRSLRRVKEIVGEYSGMSICFANGSVLHAREGHILQSGRWIKIDSHKRNLRLFAKAAVKRAALVGDSLNIFLKDRNILSIKSGFLVVNGRTFDIEGGNRLKERAIYLRDGV